VTVGVHLPHILSGASSSSRIGWLKKMSRDFAQLRDDERVFAAVVAGCRWW
jgi:hypothetical protein